jgi:hypothetical protein
MRAWKLLPAVLLLAFVVQIAAPGAQAQASSLPSAQPGTDLSNADHGRKLLDQMVAALGGQAWLNRKFWEVDGSTGSFYKGQPDPYVVGFQEFYRKQPFAERIVYIEHIATLAILGMPGKDHHDIATVWDDRHGWEVTYSGKKELPEKDVTEYERRRVHSLEAVSEWLKQPDVIVTYEGPTTVERRMAEKVSIVTATNDAVTIELDASTHLPLALAYDYRDPVYRDIDHNVEEYENYQQVQGIMTPYTITRFHNGELVGQRFVTKVKYEDALPAGLFNPDLPIEKKAK